MTMKTRATIVLFALLAFPASQAIAGPKGGRSEIKVPVDANKVNHTVQRGETLSSIAEKYYGNRYDWVRLKEYNPQIENPDKIPIGEIVFVPDPKNRVAASSPGQISLNPANLLGFMPNLSGVTFFGRTLYQIALILMIWFLFHFTSQGLFVWFAAHLAFVKDVTIKKALRATLQSESLAFLSLLMVGVIGLMLLYVGTTSPGKPVSPELFGTAEQYLGSPTGIMVFGLLIVGLYGFLGLRFIPPAFGVQPARGVAIVLIAILLPHLIGFYLVGHRMGLIS
jgi:hypothetical protein